jgi:hypothetical protein
MDRPGSKSKSAEHADEYSGELLSLLLQHSTRDCTFIAVPQRPSSGLRLPQSDVEAKEFGLI